MKRAGLIGSSTLMVGVALGQAPVQIDDTIREHPAFDTLEVYYDRSSISVDTVVVLNDILWMAVLWISDADSMPDDRGTWLRSGGVCEYVFLMTLDPRSMHVKDYTRIRTECDVDQSIREATYYSHRIREPGLVEVISSKLRYLNEQEGREKLVPFELKWLKVLQNGEIRDMGPGIFTGGLPR